MTVFAHDFMRDAAGTVGAVEVDVDGACPYFFGGVLIVARYVDSGVEECEVDGAQLFHQLRFEFRDLYRIGDVAGERDDVGAETFAHVFRQFGELVFLAGQVD